MEVLLAERDLSETLKVSRAALRQWRAAGSGPQYLRVGRAIRYRPSDVDASLAAEGLPVGR
jgi:hypothetical protein